jgi:hypothetical protein
MALDISPLFFFMPVFSFLFVFLVVFALLKTTKVLGDGTWLMWFVSFVIAIIFMSFSSLELYVRTITPWFVVMLIVVFLILLLAGMATKKLDKIMTPGFAWIFVILLIVTFLVAAIYVFNPVLHPDLIIAEGGEGQSLVSQIREYGSGSGIVGSVLLLIIAGAVAWFISKG